jgi:hypothetical protein
MTRKCEQLVLHTENNTELVSYVRTCGVVSVGSRLVPRPRRQYPHRGAPGYSLYPGSSLLHTQDTTEKGYLSLFHLITQIEFLTVYFVADLLKYTLL